MAMDEIDKNKAIWSAFGRALGAEPRDHRVIRGTSGIDHAVEAVAVDDKNGRIIVISAESNPRTAALMQVDIQSSIPGAKVLVARPVVFDVAAIARRIVQESGLTEINLVEFANQVNAVQAARGSPPPIEELFGGAFVPIALALSRVTLPPLNQILAVIQQLAELDWKSVFSRTGEDQSHLRIPLQSLLTSDGMEVDRRCGVCPIPLYELTEQDWELLLSGTRIDDIEELLKALGIYQYLFPPPDHLALGIADRRGIPISSGTLIDSLKVAPEIGHPLGPAELITNSESVTAIVDQLCDRGLLVEGEIGLEVTNAGVQARAVVKFRPREGFLSKLLQRININASVSPKDFLPPH